MDTIKQPLWGILIFSLLTIIKIKAQPIPFDKQVVDSITHILPDMKGDTNKVNNLILLTQMYIAKGDSMRVMKYAQEADSLAQKINSTIGRIRALGQMAFYHATTGNWPQSIMEINEAIPLTHTEKTEWSIFLYNLKFINYAAKNDPQQARIWALKALHHPDFESSPVLAKWPTYMQLGLSYEWENRLDSAQFYADILKEYVKKYHHPDLEGNTYTLLGNIARKRKNYDEALYYYRQGDQSAIGLAWTYDEMNKVDSAIYYAHLVLNNAQHKYDPRIIIESTQLLARLYAKTNPTLSNQYLNLYIITKDTLFNTSKLKQMEELRLNEQQLRFDQIGREKGLRSKTIQYSLMGLAALFLISALFFYRNNQIKKAANKRLEETNTALKTTQTQLEYKNRDLEIEAALERVRSKTMSMKHSNELKDAANVLSQEVRALGIPIWSCGYNIFEEDEKACIGWMSTEGAIQPSFRIPLEVSPAFIRFYESRQKGETFYEEKIGGKDLETHYKYMFTLPEFAASRKTFIEAGHLPSFQVNTVVNFTQGNLIFISAQPVPEAHDIFKRFTAVFEQTYTRFTDLQKAEAQAEQAKLDLIQIQTEKKRAEDALSELRITQNQLIQKEKLASLGELTAGIAHEIQNPLNFVNNFSELSVDLANELDDEIKKPELDRDLIADLTKDIKSNQEKINHHGKRASSIVKGMLEHSRASTGVKELTDINKLADEYLRLSYHGLRAKDSNFNSDFKTDFDENLPKIEVIPQDIGRVLLNLINNAFYAVKAPQPPKGENYVPTVIVSTQYLAPPLGARGASIIIKVKDNGKGMPESVRAKVFQPFFTTKPTGQGTGLGLSLAYDIVTKGHGGTLEVESKEGEFSEFTITLPFTISFS